MEELKHCPFCGSEAKIFQSIYGFSVSCDSKLCGIEPWAYDKCTIDEAVEAWNARTEQEAKPWTSTNEFGYKDYHCGNCCSIIMVQRDAFNYTLPSYCHNCGTKVAKR